MSRPPTSVADVLAGAWTISWRNPVLWIFGIFAGGGGGGQFRGGAWDAERLSPQGAALVLVGALVLVLVLVVLGVLAAGALVGGTDRAARGERPRFRQALSDGAGAFWRMLGLVLLVILLALPLVIPLLPGILLLVQERVLVGVLALLAGGLFDLVLGLVLAVTAAYAMRIVVLERAGPLRALAGGFTLFTDRPARAAGLAVIQLAVTLALAMVLFVPALIIALPAMAAEAAGSGLSGTDALLLGLLVAPFFLLVAGWAGTFSGAYWTLAYRWARPWPGPEPAPPAGDLAEAPGA